MREKGKHTGGGGGLLETGTQPMGRAETGRPLDTQDPELRHAPGTGEHHGRGGGLNDAHEPLAPVGGEGRASPVGAVGEGVLTHQVHPHLLRVGDKLLELGIFLFLGSCESDFLCGSGQLVLFWVGS